MSRRLHPCRKCSSTRIALVNPDGTQRDLTRFLVLRGLTRHADRVCSQCRRFGPPPPFVSYRGRGA